MAGEVLSTQSAGLSTLPAITSQLSWVMRTLQRSVSPSEK